MANTRIFLDSGNPEETRQTIAFIKLDGQTTNPSLISGNPEIQAKQKRGEKMTEEQLLSEYRKIVNEIALLIPQGSISIEVYADQSTEAATMFAQAKEMNSWITNAQIKLPVTRAGVETAIKCLENNIKVNMTLCFSQEQALIIHQATKGIKKGDVFISPFIGRLDDLGLQGIDLIKNIQHMYHSLNSQVEILAASIRSQYHLDSMIAINTDIITVPYKVLAAKYQQKTTEAEPPPNLKPIPYQDIDTNRSWQNLDITHPLSSKGLAKFAADWNALLR